MTAALPIGVEELLGGVAVEWARLELKATWEPDVMGYQVIRTIGAFANDLQNLNGGYLLLGVEEADGVAQRPVKGLPQSDLDAAQQWIRGQCKHLISPEYQPLLVPAQVDGRVVLVVWAPASDQRPHLVGGPKGQVRASWVRLGSDTAKADGAILQRLIDQTARVPFDDRRCLGATIADLRESKIREFLRDVRSDLPETAQLAAVVDALRLTIRSNGDRLLRNVAPLFFADDPEQWFPGARVEIVEFNGHGDAVGEQVVRGPLHEQVRSCLTRLDSLLVRHSQMQDDAPGRLDHVTYPTAALREAVVNAVYHRSYESSEPTKVYLYPDRIEVISYPGPVDGIDLAHLASGASVPPVPARNRRVGEFLKELRLAEGRLTGLPRIHRSLRENGSPAPRFDFDESRSYFRAVLPAHPEYLAREAIRDAAYLRGTGDHQSAVRRLQAALAATPHSAALAAELIRIEGQQGNLDAAAQVYRQADLGAATAAPVVLAMADAYLGAGRLAEAQQVLSRLPLDLADQAAASAAILEKRAGRHKEAHRLFLRAGLVAEQQPRYMLEFAQTKLKLAGAMRRQPRRQTEEQAREKLLREAAALLEGTLQLEQGATRRAWALYELSRAREYLRRPQSEVRAALDEAVRLLPSEPRFRERLARLR
ncbi:MAG: tetratricopeptide repeat protein [Fimbriimonadaceae bacterium]|nr:tetratricopeptide repeat protein [Fimbriimonadaceae bacterium]